MLLLFEGDGREVLTFRFTAPPRTGRAALGEIGECVVVDLRANVTRRGGRKWIPCQERQNIRRAFEQPQHEIDEPAVTLIISERSEPHLPVKAGLMRLRPGGRALEVAGLVFEI